MCLAKYMLQVTLFSGTNRCLHSTENQSTIIPQNSKSSHKCYSSKAKLFSFKMGKENWRNITICKVLLPAELEPKFQTPASICTKTRHGWHCVCNPLLGIKSIENPWHFPINNPAEPMYHRFKDRPSLKKKKLVENN